MLTHLKIRYRIAELVAFIAIILATLIWAERVIWRQIRDLRSCWSIEHINRLRSADELRSSILELHFSWQRGIDTTNVTNTIARETNSNRIRMLIKVLADEMNLQDERTLVNEFTADFDTYVRSISELMDKAPTASEVHPSRAAGRDVEMSLERLLKLTEKFTLASRSAIEHFVNEDNEALNQLQRFLFVSLMGLLVCGSLAIILICLRTIAPLWSTITESRSIIERHEKLASLGVFATGIAHEIRNPLTAIKVRLFSLKLSQQSGKSEQEDLEVIENEIDRLERIVREFLQFARPSLPELKTIPAGKLLRDTSQLLASELASRSIALKLDLDSDDLVEVDTGKMKQVLINIVQNAADSMEVGGTITLRSRLDRQVLNGQSVAVVVLDIIDTGKGIPPDVQKRLFDPFFTTKEEGTGLGLPIAARIVETHGGIIHYQTELLRGTTFSIVLPIASTNENKC